MLVVSDIGLTTDLQTIKPADFLESSIKGFTINLTSDYRYLKTGYYVSVHAEILGNRVIPSSEDIIDANRTPILLLKASRAGIPTLPYLVTSSVKQIISEFNFPVAVFAVNPFMHSGFKIAKNRSALYRVVKSLSMNYKFAVCVQPVRGEMMSVKSIFGKCSSGLKIGRISEKVYEVFRIPICALHVQLVEDKVCLCGLQTLSAEELLPTDLALISTEIARESSKGEHLVG